MLYFGGIVLNHNQSREKILLTATRLFCLRGYHATGMNQILKESGAPKGSLYYHFPQGKEQLAIEALTISRNLVADKLRENFKIADPVTAVQQHLQMLAEIFSSEERLQEEWFSIVPFGLMAAESAFETEAMRKACEETFFCWEDIYIQKLEEHGYSEDMAKSLSTSLIAMIEGGIILALTQKSGQPLLQVKAIIPNLLNCK